MTFLAVWIGYAIFGVSLFSLMFVWAVREHQFTNMESARDRALRSESEIEPKHADIRISRADRFVLYAIAFITVGIISTALWMGWRG